MYAGKISSVIASESPEDVCELFAANFPKVRRPAHDIVVPVFCQPVRASLVVQCRCVSQLAWDCCWRT